MAWDRGYYYRTINTPHRVIRQYIGKGPVAELCAAEDRQRRQEREAQAAAWKREKAAAIAAVNDLAAFCKLVDLIVRASLLAAGWRRCNREWRGLRCEYRKTPGTQGRTESSAKRRAAG